MGWAASGPLSFSAMGMNPLANQTSSFNYHPNSPGNVDLPIGDL